MTKRITIPATIEAATEALDGVAALLTAKEWERAAIVYAFTRSQQGRRSDLSANPEKLTFTQLAAKKIKGLENKDTVAHYYRNWQAAIDAGKATEINPGDKVTLPDMKWPATRRGTDGYDSWDGALKTLKHIVTKHGDGILDEIHPTTSKPAKPTRVAAVSRRHHQHDQDRRPGSP